MFPPDTGYIQALLPSEQGLCFPEGAMGGGGGWRESTASWAAASATAERLSCE